MRVLSFFFFFFFQFNETGVTSLFHLYSGQVVNFYCGLMQERALREADGAKQPAVHHFGSFFYAKLTETGYDYEKVRRWTTWNRLGGYTVLQTERIIVPINKVIPQRFRSVGTVVAVT